MEISKEGEGVRLPLRAVVAECVRRWFEEYLMAAEAGDPEIQLLVGHMFILGYGVERDPAKGRIWLEKAARGDHNTTHYSATSSGNAVTHMRSGHRELSSADR